MSANRNAALLDAMEREVADAIAPHALSMLPAHVNDLGPKQILVVNAHYYAKEMFGDRSSEQWAFSHKVDATRSTPHPGHRIDELLARARALLRTNVLDNGGVESVDDARIRRECRRIEREMGCVYPHGYALCTDTTLARLPEDVGATQRQLLSGRVLPQKRRCAGANCGVEAARAVPDICEVPTDPNDKPVERAHDRMVVVLHHALHHSTGPDRKAVFTALITRAQRCRDLYATAGHVRRFVRAEQRRRAALATPSLLCEFMTLGDTAVEFGDALMPYLCASTSVRLMQTCRGMRDVARAHGRTLKLALASRRPDADANASDADGPCLAFPKHLTHRNEHVVLNTRSVELKPLLRFEYLKASRLANGAPHIASSWMETPLQRECVDFDESWITVELVRDDNADPAKRSHVRNYGGLKMVTLGDVKDAPRPNSVFDPRIGGFREAERDTLLLDSTKGMLPRLSVQVNAPRAQSKHTALRIRAVVHIRRKFGHACESGAVLTADTEPFRVRGRDDSEKAKERKRKRNDADVAARRDHRCAVVEAVGAAKASRVVQRGRAGASPES